VKFETHSSMSQAKVVVFDLGKVLLDFDYTRAAKALAEDGDVSTAQVNDFINQSPLLIRYEKGQITREEFFEEILCMSGYRGSLDEFSALFANVFTPIEPMIELKQRLTAAGVPTYIFSNTNDLAITHIKATYPFYNTFDGYVLSYEHGFMKPDETLYGIVEQISGQSGDSILYFDDRAENITAGAARGWRAVHHHATEISIQAASNLGLCP
jgi:HAD superfamily hydrolase (TIGR01509 family)